jgi:hypothetical protein
MPGALAKGGPKSYPNQPTPEPVPFLPTSHDSFDGFLEVCWNTVLQEDIGGVYFVKQVYCILFNPPKSIFLSNNIFTLCLPINSTGNSSITLITLKVSLLVEQ